MANQGDENVALGNLGAAELVGLPVAGAEVLHADAVEAIQARDRLEDGVPVRPQILGRGAEEDVANGGALRGRHGTSQDENGSATSLA
jgi:hypothetical protein